MAFARSAPRQLLAGGVALAAALVALVLGITSGNAASKKESYPIGFAAGKTGFLAFFDGPVEQGIRAAIADVNARGLAGNFDLTLKVEDMKSQPALGATVVQDLLSAGSKFVVTPCDVDTGLPASLVAQRAKVPYISGCAGDTSYRQRAGDHAFLNVPGTLAEGAVMAEWAHENGWKTAYLISSKDIGYTQSMGEAFEDRFKQLGGKTVGISYGHISDNNFRAVATKAVASKADVIVSMQIVPPDVSLEHDLARAGNKRPIILNDAADAKIIYQSGPQLLRSSMVSFGYYRGKGSVADHFIASFRKLFHQDPPDDSAISGGDAIYEIAAALKKAGSSDSGKVYDAMNTLTSVVTVSGLTTYKGRNGVPVKPFTIFKFDLKGKRLIQVKLHYAQKVPPPRK